MTKNPYNTRRASITEIKREMNKGQKDLGKLYWSKSNVDFFGSRVESTPIYDKRKEKYIWIERHKSEGIPESYCTKSYQKGSKKVDKIYCGDNQREAGNKLLDEVK